MDTGGVFFFFVLFMVSTNAQLEQKYLIDDFSVTQSCVIMLNSTVILGNPAVIQTNSTTGPTTSIIGGERDMEMRVFDGLVGRTFRSDAFLILGGYFAGEWSIQTPISSSALATNQYDGVDGSFGVNLNGLDINLVNSTQLSMYVIADANTTLFVDFYDSSGNVCTGLISIPNGLGYYTYEETKESLDLSTLSGSCNQANITAIEISIDLLSGIDVIIRRIALEGPLASLTVSPTLSPSKTPTVPLEEKFIIDDFSVTQQCVIILPNDVISGDPNVVQTTSTTGSTTSIIGGERDMEMRVFTGFFGRRISSEVFSINAGYFLGEWAVENPKLVSSLATNQYDGVDGSFSVNLTNLDIDLSLATQLSIYVVADIESTMTANIYDSSGNICSGSILIPGRLGGFYDYSYDEIKETLVLSSLAGNCNLANVAAFEFSIFVTDAVDAVFRKIVLEGPILPSASQTQTSTPTSIPSQTPTQTQTSTTNPTNNPTSIVTVSDSPSLTSSITTSISITPTPTTTMTITATSSSFNSANLVHPVIINTISPISTSTRNFIPEIQSKSKTRSPKISNIESFPVIQPTSIPVTEDLIQLPDFQGNTVVTVEFENIGNSGLVLNAAPAQSGGELGSQAIESGVVALVLTDQFGTDTQPTKEVEICIMQSGDIDVDKACLGYLNEDSIVPRWECEDESLKKKDTFLCGTTDHFTNFAILLDSSNGGGSDSESYEIFIWLSIALIVLSICTFVVAVVIIESRYMLKARKMNSKLESLRQSSGTTY